jgi:small subunit ribosomal protein S19
MTLEQLKELPLTELAKHLDAAARRKIKRGFTEQEVTLLKNLESSSKKVKTHQRQMIILPSMVGKVIGVYTGKEFKDVEIQPEMIGKRLGEFALTRKKPTHVKTGVQTKPKK